MPAAPDPPRRRQAAVAWAVVAVVLLGATQLVELARLLDDGPDGAEQPGGDVPAALATPVRSDLPPDGVVVADGRVTVTPTLLPATVPVANPGKGWVVYGTADGYDDDELAVVADLAGVSYTRWDWSQLYADPADPDSLDLDVVDDFFTDWLARDPEREFAFGVMAENADDCSAEQPVTPVWVFDRGAQWVPTEVPADDSGDDRGACPTPVWTDPVLLGSYTEMLVQLRDHLASRSAGTGDGSTWLSRVQFVGVNSYGNYGEGHTFGLDDQSCGEGARFEQLPDGSSNCVISEAGFRAHAQMFLDVFTPSGTPVMVPWGSATLDADGAYDWAVQQGMGLRRDGIFGPAEHTRGRLGDDLQRAFGLAPTAFERYETSAATDPTREEFETALRIGRPSFFGLGFPEQARVLWDRSRDVVVANQRRLGYDFSLAQASFPQQWPADATVAPELRWRNDGLDYTHEPARVGLALLDADGRTVATSFPATGSNPLRWEPGTTTTERPEVAFTGVAPGRYRLAVGLADRRSGSALRLAHATAPTSAGWYPLAEVEITAPTAVAAEGGGPGPAPVVLEPELAEASTIGFLVPGVVARTHVLLRDERLSSGMGDRFNAVDPGDAVSYRFEVPTAGPWSLDLTTLAGPDRGSLQVSVDGVEVGGRVDTGAATEEVRTTTVGTADLAAGEHVVLLTATGPLTGTGTAFVVDRIDLRAGAVPTPAAG